MKKMNALVLCLLLVLSLVLSACGGSEPSAEAAPTQNASGEIEYKVTVVDAQGTPFTTGVIVRFMKDGQQAAMQPVDGNGSAAKTLAAGEYAVELMFTGNEDEYYYNKEGLTLTAQAPALTVTLTYNMSAEPVKLVAQGKDVDAYPVTDGSTRVSLVPGQRNYFLYTPTVAGTFAFSSDNENAVIGYYGAPHFVQEMSAAEVVDNTFTQSIRATMIGENGTTVIVIGIDADANTDSCTLSVIRTGDPEWSVEDEPWTVYEPTVELAAYTLPAGANIQEFDLTADTSAYNLVLGSDGFYHLDSEDGALVLVHLSKDPKYLPCFKNILDRSGVNRYFYDESGNFLKKETYDQCLLRYIECADEDSGLYPLTEDLKYIIQQRGDYSGWWDISGPNYLFVDQNQAPLTDINPDIAWLFMCCYMAK